MKIAETSIAKSVIEFLKEQDWDIYQEVSIRDGVADIVAVQNGRIWIIECKTSLGIAVLSQANRWMDVSNWRSVAVPLARRSYDERKFIRDVCSWKGIGLIEVDKRGDANETERASLNRSAISKPILDSLCPEHKTYSEAGTNSGKHWSPWKNTCKQVRDYVERNPGCNLKTLIDSITYHYKTASSARAGISHWALSGKIDGVRCQREGKHLRFYSSNS